MDTIFKDLDVCSTAVGSKGSISEVDIKLKYLLEAEQKCIQIMGYFYQITDVSCIFDFRLSCIYS